MSASALFGSRLAVSVAIPSAGPSRRTGGAAMPSSGLVIGCSSRPPKKATEHHMKTRPRKSPGWRKRGMPFRGYTPFLKYTPLPPFPDDWTPVSDDGGAKSPAAETGIDSDQAPPPN